LDAAREADFARSSCDLDDPHPKVCVGACPVGGWS
jgi:hypothetical protein